MIAVFSYGGMPEEMATENMRLFAERVLPNLERTDTRRGIGEPAGAVPVPSRA